MTYGNYPDLSRVKKVLVVKLRHLGDVLLTTPVFSSLKNALPDAQIDAFVYEGAAPMLEGHPAVSKILTYNSKWKKGFFFRLKKEISLIRQIRKEGYDLVVNLTEGDRGVLIAWLSGAKIRVGFSPKGKLQKKLVTHVVKHCPGLRHTVERNLDALRCIGIFPEESMRELFFQIGKTTQKTPFILIHPTSRWRFKCLPVPKMRELIKELLRIGKRVILTSGPDPIEVSMVEAIACDLNVEVFAGKTTLKELGALIHACEVLICVDSVPFHIASALKSPVIAIFGPTSDVTWGPWRNPKARVVSQNFSCRPCYQDGCGGSKYSDCLQTLSVERILSELKVFSEVSPSRLRIGQELIHCSCK